MAQHKIKVTFSPKPLSQRLSLDIKKYQMQDANGSVVYENAKYDISGDSLQISLHAVAPCGTTCTLFVEIDGKAQNYKGAFDSNGFADVSDFIDVPINNPKDKTIPFPSDGGANA